jgi:hypothetical protein
MIYPYAFCSHLLPLSSAHLEYLLKDVYQFPFLGENWSHGCNSPSLLLVFVILHLASFTVGFSSLCKR